MAHIEKFTRAALPHMLGHYDRTGSDSRDHIDHAKSHLNYDLAEIIDGLDKPLMERYKDVMQDVKCLNRKNVNVICDWIVTVPKDLPEDQTDAFFAHAYEFLKERYRVADHENIVSACVHKDEATPHMHFCFVPLVKDVKHGDRYKVSAKDVVTRSDLQKFHGALKNHLEREMEIEVNVMNGATRLGNQTIQQLKAQKEIEDKITDAQDILISKRDEIRDADWELRLIDRKREQAQENLREVYENLKAVQNDNGWENLLEPSLQEKIEQVRGLQRALNTKDAANALGRVKEASEANKEALKRFDAIKDKEGIRDPFPRARKPIEGRQHPKQPERRKQRFDRENPER